MSALTGVFEEHNNNYRCSRLFVHVSLEGREEKDDRMEVALRQDGAADESSNDSTTPPTPTMPRRFRTAYIMFSSAKHKEIRQGLGKKGKHTKVR
jgi:hypothetical protein